VLSVVKLSDQILHSVITIFGFLIRRNILVSESRTTTY